MTTINLSPPQRELLSDLIRKEFDKSNDAEAQKLINLAKSLKLHVLANEMQEDLDIEQEMKHCKINNYE